jgi:para-nitrobenzyl esterase
MLGTPNETLAEVTGDAFFVCPARRTVRLLASAGHDVYLYAFNRGLEGQLVGAGKVLHSGEIPFVFGNSYILGSVADADRPLSEAMMGYWTRFAESGDPNGGGADAWPKYEQATDEHIILDLPISSGSAHKKAVCDFWDSLRI